MFMDEQGTVSVDLLFAAFIFLIILGYTSTLILDRFNTVDRSQELVEARSLAENIAGAINQAYAGGNGHVIKIRTPDRINNDDKYHVEVNSSGVLVVLEDRRGLAYIIPQKFSKTYDNLQSSTIILSPAKEYVIINKREGKGDNWIVIIENNQKS